MADKNKLTGFQSAEKSSTPPVTGEEGLRPIENLAKQDKDSKNKYIEGPFLGIVAHIQVIDASKDPETYYGEILKTPFITLKLRVFVPDMETTCGELTLPIDDNWNSSDMNKIKKLPQFVGQHAYGDDKAHHPTIGDIVSVDYYDRDKPYRGGKYLGIAYSKHGTHNLKLKKAREEFQKKVRDDVEKTLLEAERRRKRNRNLGIKECIKDTDIENVGFLPPGSVFLRDPTPNINDTDMLYGQICMLGFGEARKVDFNKEIVEKYDPELNGKPALKLIHIKSKLFKGNRTLKVHVKAELAFRMVFKQLDYMYEKGDEQIKKFRIKGIGGYRPLECVRTGDYKQYLETGTDGVKGCRLKVEKHGLKAGDIAPYPLGVSRHCFGLAIDINHKENPHVSKEAEEAKKQYKEWQEDDGIYRIPQKVIQVFKYYGFRWGGNFKRKDLHHFDFVGDPVHIIASYKAGLDYARKELEEVPMTSYPSEEYLKIGNDSAFWNEIVNNVRGADDLYSQILARMGILDQ